MISDLTITGLGPIRETRDYELGGLGSSLVQAPSEDGKTVGLIEATCFVLWAEDSRGRSFPVEGVNDDCDEAVVTLRMASGTVISRSMSKKNRAYVRQIIRNETLEEYPREDAFQLALGPLGTDRELLRTIMVPFAWVPLQERNARPLRDLLARILPQMDLAQVVAKLMHQKGFEFQTGDPILEPEAVEARRVANVVAERASEALRVAMEIATEEQPQVEPPEMSRESAAAVLELAKTVAYFRLAEAERADWIAWHERREALGQKPIGGPDGTSASELAAAEDRLLRLSMALPGIETGHAWFGDVQLSVLKQELADAETALRAAPKNTVCPTCERKGWDKAKEKRAAAEQRVSDAGLAMVAFEQTRAEQWEEWKRDHEPMIMRARAELAAAKQEVADLRAAWQAQRTEDPTAAWEKAIRALGPEPMKGRVEPTAPEREQPTNADVIAATTALTAWDRYEGAARQREQATELHEGRVRRAAEMERLAKRQAERLDALVQATRDAPSVIAREQAAVLGDLGPVKFRFGNDPSVEVLIDGRPWQFASHGKRIFADCWLRNAIRRAAGLPWLPLFVDDSNLWSNDLPAFPPMIVLRTEKR